MSGEHEYELLERIGIGGMAEVYRANSLGAEGFERPIAIKRILPHLATDDDFVKMFIDEAKIAVQLSHPNIVGIFDLGRFGDDYFIAMELVHGRDLRQIQDREAQLGRRMPLEIALHAAMKVCEALHHAHFKGGSAIMGDRVFIIHRDVSPQNVLVSYDGQVKVTDFGLAKAAGRAVQTQAGIIKGKLAYMSPEQLTNVPIDQRSDVFAAGTLLWEMLTGARLFLGANDRETIQNVFKAEVQSPRALDPAIPIELDRVVMKALAKDRDERYQTAQELFDDLEEAAYAVNAMIGGPSVTAYMRALFPEAEVSGSARRRDPRAATAEIRLSDVANGPGRNPVPAPFPSAEGDDGGGIDDELDEADLEDEPEELDDDDVQAEPESIAPPAAVSMLEDEEDDDEESRKTIPPADLFDAATPGDGVPPVHTVEHEERYPEPASAMRATPGAAPRAASGDSGARAVVRNLQAPSPIISPAQYASFGQEDDFDDRTLFGEPSNLEPPPSLDSPNDASRATLEYQGDLNALAAQLARMADLESLPADTSEGRLAPEELLTTKAHAPSNELIARSRREREMATRPMPPVPDEAPAARDTIPPVDDYDDRTVVGGAIAPRPPIAPQEWEDETTPAGGEPKSGRG
jgi:serine/threonine protein kinase